MSEVPEHWLIVLQWIEKADHDLQNARHTLKIKKGCPFDTICFHAQQCAEKYLKALLTLEKADFPKTHDLTELAFLLPRAVRKAISSADLAELNPYAIEARYPGSWEPQTRRDAVRAITIASRLRTMARRCLPSALLKMQPG